MGEYVSIGDSLIITLFSITMVFLVLIVISVFISLLKNLDGKEKTQETKQEEITTKASSKAAQTEENQTVNEEELVAVISAAIAASLGVSIPEIKIKKINRVSGNLTAWSSTSRQEQIYTRL